MPTGAVFFEYCVKGLTKYSRKGLLGEICDKLRIQCRMQIFEKMSQSALNHVLILQKDRTQKMRQIPLKIIDLQNDFNILVAKQWKIIISVPMSYIINLYKKKTIIIIKKVLAIIIIKKISIIIIIIITEVGQSDDCEP